MQSIWIEIPATDLERANRFYAAVFGHDAPPVDAQETRSIAIIEGTPSVSLNRTEGFVPSPDGALPYFAVEDLGVAVDAVVAHGGRVIEAPNERPGLGHFALVGDSEGNALYLFAAS
ncbi:VOC family protein [Svornostia abyssi]|uniref:VOC family protein n=1 Tax=Svornostia abyssi TaxID=2898438 RepID=A0ABY5PL10_9ACTN|nr:VOC family protein [Parviterribacteraceae bacterium J379]